MWHFISFFFDINVIAHFSAKPKIKRWQLKNRHLISCLKFRRIIRHYNYKKARVRMKCKSLHVFYANKHLIYFNLLCVGIFLAEQYH